MKPPSAGKEILLTLLQGLDLYLEWAENRGAFRRKYFTGRLSQEEWLALTQERRHDQAVRRLRRKKWLDDKQEGDTLVYHMQFDAVVSALQHQVRVEKKNLPRGTCCLVVFDFPVGANAARTFWRRFLRRAGFAQKQLSVWISYKDVTQLIDTLIHLLRVERRVAVYTCQEPK